MQLPSVNGIASLEVSASAGSLQSHEQLIPQTAAAAAAMYLLWPKCSPSVAGGDLSPSGSSSSDV